MRARNFTGSAAEGNIFWHHPNSNTLLSQQKTSGLNFTEMLKARLYNAY
jgi:hypothetical protein